MVKGLEIIERIKKNDRVTHFKYKVHESYVTTEEFEKMTDCTSLIV